MLKNKEEVFLFIVINIVIMLFCCIPNYVGIMIDIMKISIFTFGVITSILVSAMFLFIYIFLLKQFIRFLIDQWKYRVDIRHGLKRISVKKYKD